MNDIDLWNEAESLTEEKDKKLQKIGWELFDLYDRAYNNHFKDDDLNNIVEYNIWNIYDDIWNNVTFKDSLNKYNVNN